MKQRSSGGQQQVFAKTAEDSWGLHVGEQYGSQQAGGLEVLHARSIS